MLAPKMFVGSPPRHDLEALARLGPSAYAKRLKQERRRQRRKRRRSSAAEIPRDRCLTL
jgi:hypothetical protein